ncbi:ABC transporter ATP-binding protein [Corynebacterium cystitidis]|uniref:ATP-binding cassette, subfamily B n=1 Tax=Corynebacterium cystitidis DSM 20524 TaxID=1121357 RepID=A0A1H9RBJ4_9CORY|nr:ABC transporter ATP-binding protein [Corynebacterium cystitidis]WJY81484.1 Iron import ATP-binding/permease protein IrtA [Corynebacterium cystitidis DSM 20524]SER70301.1 ATP-binding cassette, subfamily B [Corynebacterium cystitidis DSM 20524]SNV87054.1 ABC transporter ATP-binding protein/permease [Corynebacterium cystitidis]
MTTHDTAADTQAPKNLKELTKSAHRAMNTAAVVTFFASALKVLPYISLVEISRILLSPEPAEPSGPTNSVWTWVIVAIVAMVIHAFTYTFALGATHVAEANLRSELRHKLVNKLGRVPLGWHSKSSSGKIWQAVVPDTTQIHSLVAHSAGDSANTLGALVAGLVYLFWLNAGLAATLLGIFLAVVIVTMTFAMRGGEELTERYLDSAADLASSTAEMVDGIKEVKNFGITESVFSRFDEAQKKNVDASLAWMKKSGVGVAILMALMQPGAMLALTLGVGFVFTQQGWITPIDVVAFALVWVGIPEGAMSLVQMFQLLQSGEKAAENTIEILNTPELQAPDSPATLTKDPALVEGNSVDFSYDGQTLAINDVSFTCPPGSVTALVGPSGSGKTTLARLIARFWDVDQGAIEIGGVDVRQHSNSQLLGSMALVFQEVMTANVSVADNIALGKESATHEEIVEAAKAAQIHDRIMALPKGYDTVLGSNEGFLSGGEQQRLTIARAFLAAPKILILDEATSQSDAHSELAIQRAISALAEGRTVLMIAHRLSTIQSADQILVMEDGHVSESGTHSELLAAQGTYARMWAAQEDTMKGEEK